MAAESIGTLIPTKIPGLADAADIQAALRVYHYGSYDYDTASTSTAALVNPSIAYEIQSIKDDITTLENRPSSGGQVNTTSPAYTSFTPIGIPDGYIWVDEDGTLGGSPTGATAVFTNTAPTSSLTTGTIWVDKDATTITANPFIPQAIIAAKGDLVVGSANDTATVISAGTNGYILSANSATASGLEWIANDQGDLTALTSGTGISLTNATGPIPTVAVDTALVATTSNTMTMSNKTLTTPTVNYPILVSPQERTYTSASTASGTINIDTATAATWYYTNEASANHTLNFRHSSNTSLSSTLSVGDSVTIVWLNTNGSTAYYPNVIQIDAATSTPKWQGGTAPTAGNASSVDAYVFNIVKTAATPTYTILASQTKFA